MVAQRNRTLEAQMLHVLQRADLIANPETQTVKFEGEPYGADVSFFVAHLGAELHQHPYAETFVVHAGRALITAGEQEVEAGPAEIVVVGPGMPHKFERLGAERLEIVCIHASGRMTTQWL
jgi:mannose-6-phosphate isomerase-like protein (cupin superfamily)